MPTNPSRPEPKSQMAAGTGTVPTSPSYTAQAAMFVFLPVMVKVPTLKLKKFGNDPLRVLDQYFSEAGTVRSIRGEIKKTGKWWVDEKGNHCVQWMGKKKGCAPITKEGSTYKKYKMRSGAGGGSRIKWVKTFIKFSPGNSNNL